MILVNDTQPHEPKTLLEMKVKKTSTAPAPGANAQATIGATEQSRGAQSADQPMGGAAEAAGVLNAVDEDEEGGEEAELPRDFEYFSEDEDGQDS